jgi:hypothetical protein
MNRSVEDITTAWKTDRDKMVLDYKRKRKDVSSVFINLFFVVRIFLIIFLSFL